MLDAAERLAACLDQVRAGFFDARSRRCDYRGLSRSGCGTGLREALDSVADGDPMTLPIPGPLAFWLNAYNASAMLGVLDAGALTGVREIPGFFTQQRFRIAGDEFSLDLIEHGLLRGNATPHGRLGPLLRGTDRRLRLTPRLWDERIHFALHCATRSSPALRVYRPAMLGDALEGAARDYLAAEVSFDADLGTLVIPQQFQWYAQDFGDHRAILEFVSDRIEDDELALAIGRQADTVRFDYRAYDWSLNAMCA